MLAYVRRPYSFSKSNTKYYNLFRNASRYIFSLASVLRSFYFTYILEPILPVYPSSENIHYASIYHNLFHQWLNKLHLLHVYIFSCYYLGGLLFFGVNFLYSMVCVLFHVRILFVLGFVIDFFFVFLCNFCLHQSYTGNVIWKTLYFFEWANNFKTYINMKLVWLLQTM